MSERPEVASERPEQTSERPGLASGMPGLAYERPGLASKEHRGQMYRFPLYSTGFRPLRSPPGPLPKKENSIR